MDKHLMECLEVIDRNIERAVMNGQVSGTPFVAFTNQSAHIFGGFEAIVELLQIDLIREGSDGEEDRLMTRRQKDALLGMIRATSQVMLYEASGKADWARKRMEENEVAK